MYDYVTSYKNYTLLQNTSLGTYKITANGKALAHPTTEEKAWERLRELSGSLLAIHPTCWDSCRIHDCINCDRYF